MGKYDFHPRDFEFYIEGYDFSQLEDPEAVFEVKEGITDKLECSLRLENDRKRLVVRFQEFVPSYLDEDMKKLIAALRENGIPLSEDFTPDMYYNVRFENFMTKEESEFYQQNMILMNIEWRAAGYHRHFTQPSMYYWDGRRRLNAEYILPLSDINDTPAVFVEFVNHIDQFQYREIKKYQSRQDVAEML